MGCSSVTDLTLPNISQGAPFGVTALQLGCNNLRGTIPASLAASLAPSLQLLDVADNVLEGSLPTSLFAMSRLHSIFLFGRGDPSNEGKLLTGSLPDPICASAPSSSSSGSNSSSGSQPSSLKYVHMQRQNLSGSIPPSIANCSNLNQLHLFDNQLTGHVPESLTHLPLHTVYMQQNHFTCPFPCFKRYSPYANFDCSSCPPPKGTCYPC